MTGFVVNNGNQIYKNLKRRETLVQVVVIKADEYLTSQVSQYSNTDNHNVHDC
jgi:hypothetical protein